MLTKVITKKTQVVVFLLLFYSTLDLILTCYALRSGMYSEGNPVLHCFPLGGIGLMKTLGLVFLCYRFHDRLKVLWVVTIIMAAVCVWNALLIGSN